VSTVLLTPGAGAGRDNAQLVAIDKAVSVLGHTVERMDFPYRLAGRKAPDRPPVLINAIREKAEAIGATLLGGRSMGGRMCSMAVAEGVLAEGLILVSYPLHPPGRPEKSRTEHFPSIKVPCLFVSGTRDSFGRPEELEAATKLIPGSVTHVWLDGGDHGLARKNADVSSAVADWVQKLS
jgi:uncharacterized protein